MADEKDKEKEQKANGREFPFSFIIVSSVFFRMKNGGLWWLSFVRTQKEEEDEDEQKQQLS